MTNSEKTRFKSPSRAVSNHSPTTRQDQVRSNMKSRTSGPRPLGTPASDISMYYDRRMVATARVGRPAGHRKGRSGLCASADMERRRSGQQNKGSWVHNGLVSGVTDHHSFTALISPQLGRRQTRTDNQPTRELGLTRSHTVAELRTPRLNLTGVNGERPRPQLTRASTWCAMQKPSTRSMSRFSSSSTSSLPLISSSEGRDALISASCEGLTERVSALRSLANNPKFKVSIVNGAPQISPRLNSVQCGLETTTSQKNHSREVVVEPSKYGYHSRSNSPTYRRLIHAKEQLDVALCKKLREVRQQLDGQTARENSTMGEGLRMAMDERRTASQEEWYQDMVEREMENDKASEVIENMTMANCEPLSSLENFDLTIPPPHINIKFDIRYLKSHINDWDILNINVEEEEKKMQERRDKEKRRRPIRARSPSPTHFRRTCEACCVPSAQKEEPRVHFLRANKSRKVKFRRRQRKESDDSDTDTDPPLMMDEPIINGTDMTSLPLPLQLPSDPTSIPVNIGISKGKKKTRSERRKSTKSSKSTKSKSSSSSHSVKGEINSLKDARNIEWEAESEENVGSGGYCDPKSGVDQDVEIRLPSLSSSSPYTDNPPASITDDRESIGTTVESSPPAEGKPKLTDKEKFLMMRKRMQERQEERLKKKESFVDYSMIAFHGTRKERAGRGQKGLGNTLSNRLESMATFKSNRKENVTRKGLMSMLGSDDDDDDDDEDDDYDENDEEDNVDVE